MKVDFIYMEGKYIYRTEYPVEAEKDDEEDEDEAEVTLEKLEEEMQDVYEEADEEDEEDIRHLDDFADLTQNMVKLAMNGNIVLKREITSSDSVTKKYTSVIL